MLEVYKLSYDDQPFPRRKIGEYASPEAVMRALKFTQQEMTAGMSGKLVRHRFLIDFTPQFYHDLAIDLILHDIREKKNSDRLTHRDVAGALGIAEKTSKRTLANAIGKLKASGKLKGLIKNLVELREGMERMETDADGPATEIKITIES